MPKVSVIIPTYNRAEYLKKSLASVLNQTFKDFELLIIDDCSKDNTTKVIENIDDRRIIYLRNSKNMGIAAVRNRGIENAKGEYIAFLDDDDEWTSVEKLGRQISLFEKSSPETGLIYTGVLTIDQKTGKKIKELVPNHRGFVLNEFVLNKFLNMSTIVLRKACFDKVGLFDETIPYAEDFDMWIRILKVYKVDYIKEQLVICNHHDGNLTKNIDSVIDGLDIVLNKNEVLLNSNKIAYANLLLELGVRYCYKKETKHARKIFKKAIKLYPYNTKLYFNYILSLLGADKFAALKKFKAKYFPKRVQKI